MRSVFVHFQEFAEQIARDWLDKHMTNVAENEWEARSQGTTTLFCGLSADIDDWEPEELSEFRSVIPEPSAYVQIDISGKIPGDREVRKTVLGLLSSVSGSLAQDDYTDHLWTLREIYERSVVEGHPFFDYLGWQEEGQH